MFVQKAFKNGNSLVVTLPKEYLRDLNIRDGSELIVNKEASQTVITIEHKDKRKKVRSTTITPDFIKWMRSFDKEYHQALKELAGK